MSHCKDEAMEERKSMRKTLQIAGSFIAFFFVLIGAYWMISSLEIVSSPYALDGSQSVPNLRYFHLEFMGTPSFFYLACILVAASLTFLWRQR